MNSCCCQIIKTHLRRLVPWKLSTRVNKIYTLNFSQYMVSATTGTSPRSMSVKSIKLASGSGYDTIRGSALPLGWKRPLCSDYKIPTVGNASGNLLWTFVSSYHTHRIWMCCLENYLFDFRLFECGSDTYKSGINEHIDTQFMCRHNNSICCKNRQVEFTKGKKPILGSAMNDRTVKN